MELYTIPITGVNGGKELFIIFRPLKGVAFIGNTAMAALAREVANNGLVASPNKKSAVHKFLKSCYFFEPDPPPPTLDIPDSFKPSHAVLLLTNQCHLRCTYCYAAAGENPSKTLSIEAGKLVIDTACKNAEEAGVRQFKVSFHGGGEPVFPWSTLLALTNHTRSKSISANISITSNGIWSESQTEWVMRNIDGVSISMDGMPETQNRNRPLVSGRPSSGLVMRTLALLDERTYPYNIRMTAAAPWSELPANVRFICEQTKARMIQVEPAFNLNRGEHSFASVDEADAFIDAFLEAFDVAEELGKRLRYPGARVGFISSTFCSAPYNALIINPEEKIVACYEVANANHQLAVVSTFGTLDGDRLAIDREQQHQLYGLMEERRASCRDCFCYWQCAGDCFARTFTNKKDGHLVHSTRCEINRKITEKILLKRIAEGNGVAYLRTSSPRKKRVTHERK